MSLVRVHWMIRRLPQGEYAAAVARQNKLLDEAGSEERRPRYGLLDTLGA